jgi:hypothetical protein
MAAVGALLISSGIALMAAPTTASAAQFKQEHLDKIVVCKYVGTPGESRLQTGNNPIVVSANTLRHLVPKAWFDNPTFPVNWRDAQGQAGGGSIAIGFVGDVAPVITSCPGYEPEPEDITPAAPTFVEPTCTTAPAVQTPTSTAVSYAVTGDKVAGGTVHVVASLVNPETTQFASGVTTSWDHTFTTPTGCTNVSPPQVSPPKAHVKSHVKAKAETTTPTVVHAGLAGNADSSTQAGLGLTAAGLLLLAGAGGLVLVQARERK